MAAVHSELYATTTASSKLSASSSSALHSPAISQSSSAVSSPVVKPALAHSLDGISSTENLNGASNGRKASLTPPPEKPSMTKRITRMFSVRDVSKQASPSETPVTSVPAATTTTTTTTTINTKTTTNSAAAPSTSVHAQTPPPRSPASMTPSHDPAVAVAHPPSVTEKQQRTRAKSLSKDGCPPVGRFVPDGHGSHEHFLRSAKRQEKLSAMWWDMLGAKKKGEQPPHDGDKELSLMSSWVDQLKRERDLMATDRKGGPNSTATLVQKYGKCQEVVGRGAFGIVRISHKRNDAEGGEQLYAVKEFRRRPDESEKKYSKRLTAEFCISSSLRHPNIIHTLDLLQDAKGDYCEVMEYCAGGDLYTLILAAGKLEVTEADCFFKQLMRGVEYMHEMGVAHRDLKPENLLLTTHGALKITDFGNGECFRMAWETQAHMVSGLCGSAPYIAPEEYTDTEFDARAVDVWATGVIYMAMRTGRHLWRVAQRDEDEFYARYLEGRRDEEGYGPIETLHRARCRNVIYSILDPKPSRRITASQVLKSEWGREIKVCSAGEEGF